MKISIPEPCSEDWSKMTPTEQGAYCQKCTLEVTDFTNKSSLEIKTILENKIESKQRVCGHIENRQLVEFNDGFIPWNSDRESFRTIWMFSLVAVFGMTLFSCQSTFSKEVVTQMQTSSEVLMEEEKDTLDLALLNDSIHQMTNIDSFPSVTPYPWLPGNPYDITGGPVVTNGGIGWELEGKQFEINICTIWLGDMLASGFVAIDTHSEETDSLDKAKFIFNPMNQTEPAAPTQSPRANDRNQLNSQRIDAKLENGRPEFTAYISPLPIDKTSKLFVTIPEEGELKLSIWKLDSMSKLYFETLDLVFGNHSININFEDFQKGKYAVQLIWEEEKVVIPFEIPEGKKPQTTS